MKKLQLVWLSCAAGVLLLSPAGALAQEEEAGVEGATFDDVMQEGQEPDDDDMQQDVDPDPHPEVPNPIAGDGADYGLERQAGTGGPIAYAEAGVFELGGGASFDFAEDLTSISIRPTAGWFFLDNLQASIILDINYINTNDQDAWTFGAFVEPSFHLPFTNRVLGFLGAGLGINYNSEDTGFAVRPRIGVDILVGRSGIFRPSFDLTWSTVDLVTRGGNTEIAIDTSYGLSFSYSVML